MQETNTFGATIICGNRITIKKDVFEAMGLKKGERLKVTIERVFKGNTVL